MERMCVCHSLRHSPWATRPPVKATLRLAPQGLDWARPRCRQKLTGGNGRFYFIRHSADRTETESVKTELFT